MARRKNPRAPEKVSGLRARLERLRTRQNATRRPWLSARTLWHLQYAGLWHLIPRDPTLAERWLITLEQAAQLECGTLLTTGMLPDKALALLRRRMDAFAALDLGPGKPKAGMDWKPLADDVRLLADVFARLKKQAPVGDPLKWWRPHVQRLWHGWFFLNQQRLLMPLDVHNVVASRTPRAKAIELVGRARGMDPKLLARNLSRWQVVGQFEADSVSARSRKPAISSTDQT